MPEDVNLAEVFNRDGFFMLGSAFGPEELKSLLSLDTAGSGEAGVRNVLDDPCVADLARSEIVRRVVDQILSPEAFAVRGILFDKNPTANWALGMHQDTKIAIQSRAEVAGFSNWSQKDGVDHVQPPAEVLERQIAFRIHLDPCGPDNGPVHLIPRTHRGGIWTASEVSELSRQREHVCSGDAGSVLVFSSLLLHGSPRAAVPTRRRVLHLEFCDHQLRAPLAWRWRI